MFVIYHLSLVMITIETLYNNPLGGILTFHPIDLCYMKEKFVHHK
jgi:hypothetical protein